jgi:murein DD-endopeptidase MepM/ murein hydrolase activator NlpD
VRSIPRRSWPVATAIATGLAVLLAVQSAWADPRDDKARVDRELAATKAALEGASERVNGAATSLADANRRLPEVQRRLADARTALSSAKVKAGTAAKAARTAADDLAAADRALARATVRVDETHDEIGRLAATAYMGGDVAGIQALLSVESPADFVAGLTYMDHVATVQKRALDAYTEARTRATESQSVQAQRKRALDAAKRKADAAVREAATAEAEASRAEREIANLVAQRQQALKVAEQERAATEARYAELQAESERIAAEIRAMASGGGPVVRAGARLPMPVNGVFTSGFGMRFDPVYRVWRLHAGVDLAAPGGTPIWAAAAGRVFRAGWSSGYGNYTCVFHGTMQGKGFATCYAHQSAILVSSGQQVRQGQVIGRVGTTGASTGNHLHFEVRLDGAPVDPLPWLPACLC